MVDFRDRLVSMLPFVIDDIEPIENPISLEWIQHNDPINELLEKLVSCLSGKSNATNYEILCTQMLKVAFSDDLALWEAESYSNEKLYRFDLLCRIKD